MDIFSYSYGAVTKRKILNGQRWPLMAVPDFGSSRSAVMGGCPGVQGLGFRFGDALLIRYFYVAVGALPVTSVLALFWLALFASPAKHNQLAYYFRAS
jgi:phage shock protein PspC (stress-responsive transcriptional regulator)